MAVRMYAQFLAQGQKATELKEKLKKLFSVSNASISSWVSDIDQNAREAQKKEIANLWHLCYSEEEIADKIGISQKSVNNQLLAFFPELEKLLKVSFSEETFERPIYNVWAFGKKSNSVDHFGNTEKRITDNLLYLFTNPKDIVVDPFGGGGATLDVCINRGRRCWISDRNPKPGLEEKIRLLDIAKELPPLYKRWSDVSLTFLDPPYWRQAENQYSDSPEDLANMPLNEFTENMVSIIRRISEKQSKGAIAMILQPTQWKSDNRQFEDHIFDICKGVEKSKNLRIWNRVQCPYQTEQCTPQMVNWAKDNKNLLVLSRELVIWKFI